MLRNAFVGQSKCPTEKQLASALGESHALWQQLLVDLKRELKLDKEEWNSYSVKAGWSLRLQLKKRNIVYLSPGDGCFLASFALGDKALAAARNSMLPRRVLKIMNEAKRYAEGTAVRLEVRESEEVDVVKALAKIKIDN
jgi:hypothetical protein